jgi:hypothetical protein
VCETPPLHDRIIRATPVEIKRLKANFRNEARRERVLYRDSISREWELVYSSLGDKENLGEEYGEVVSHFEGEDIAYDEFVSHFEGEDEVVSHDRMAAERRASFYSSFEAHSPPHRTPTQQAQSAKLLQNRADELWAGLRRVYFGEHEAERVTAEDHAAGNEALREEIRELMERLARRRRPIGSAPHPPDRGRRNDPEDPEPGGEPSMPSSNPVPNPSSGSSPQVSSDRVVSDGPSSKTNVNEHSTTQQQMLQSEVSDGEKNGEAHEDGLPGSSSEKFLATTTATAAPYTWKKKFMLLSQRILRRVMAAKETLFKFGTFVPSNDREAEASPEAHRWRAGRALEWLRLNEQGTFDGTWTWDKLQIQYPTYHKQDIGHLFYVYDYKFSGEQRVRLVFDGSRQSEATYKETYAPTVRAESVRLFHVFCVEEGFPFGQYDVPQAFLKADIDYDIFVYPPKGQSEFPGQLLKLRRALYGGKQSAFLWFSMINSFLLDLGFTPSPLDSCFYRRADALLILYCDDLRIGATPDVLASLHQALVARFDVTTAPGNRFLGMDVQYDLSRGILKLSMESYIESTMARFDDFDLSRGYPFRELMGCLLWVTLNVMGPELLRVKDLARRSNSFGELDYAEALKVLRRISSRKQHGIVIFRHAAGKETVPSSTRPIPGERGVPVSPDDTGASILSTENELVLRSLCHGKALFASEPEVPTYSVDDPESINVKQVLLPVNNRYNLLVYGDASFAIGESKQSVTGYIVYLNGVPLLWGSLKQPS